MTADVFTDRPNRNSTTDNITAVSLRIMSCMLLVITILFTCGTMAFAKPKPTIDLKNWHPADNEYWIRVDKPVLRLSLFQGEVMIKSWPVAVGRGKGKVKKVRGDCVTPAGTYEIWRVIQDARKLVWDPRPFGEPGLPRAGVYGAKLISFHNPWGIAIHGTSNPKSIGKRVTHGCIRLRNKDIIELASYVKPPMVLVIAD